MIHTCTQCGGIYSDAEGEAIAGKACMCNRARLVYLTEQDVRRIVREELDKAKFHYMPREVWLGNAGGSTDIGCPPGCTPGTGGGGGKPRC